VTVALRSYPTGWIKTLEYIDSLDASLIVPGHGEPLGDERLLKATIALLKDLQKRGADASKVLGQPFTTLGLFRT